MAQETLNGNEYIVFIDSTTAITAAQGAAYEALMCMVSNGFSISVDAQDVSNKCNDGFGNSSPGTGSWEMSGDGHAIDEATGEPSATSYQSIAQLALDKTKFWAKIAHVDGVGGIIHREGVVWISSYEETAGTDEPYSFSFTFTGVGKPLLAPVVTP